MFKKSAPVIALGGLLLAVSTSVIAAQGGSKGGTSVVPTVSGSGNVSAEALIQRYGSLAGSADNATSLVNGLRTGDPITLTDAAPPPPPPPPPAPMMVMPDGTLVPPPPPFLPASDPAAPVRITFSPPTGNMGWGAVDIALALTQALLTQQDISGPNATQLHAALMDSENGILQLRSRGMGWPNIAKTLGFTLK